MKRPQIHFTPPSHWTNDPNGLVYIQGKYHLFYQHYPEDIVWGPMHWGHAVSEDLLHWEHKEIALYPDELGYIFSGSCIYDEENVSGLGTKEQPPLIAFFTSHRPENGQEQQSIAYSLDFEHFVKYEGNPVILNREKKDFRDPKVFPNLIKGGFSMVLAAGADIEFYHSDNLLQWKKTGVFTPGTHGYGGLCECPDCFPMETAEGTKWILSISMGLAEEKAGKTVEEGGFGNVHVMQYYVGVFDGDTFVDTQQSEVPLLLDYGTDHYAAVTFANTKEKIMLGWGENWDYVSETPAQEYRGKMTLARKLSLVNTECGWRLASEPIGGKQLEEVIWDKECEVRLNKSCFTMRRVLHPQEEIVFENAAREVLTIQVMQDKIVVDRSLACSYDFSSKLSEERYHILCAPRIKRGDCPIEVIYDEGYFEIFAEEGLITFSVMTFAEGGYEKASLHKVLR